MLLGFDIHIHSIAPPQQGKSRTLCIILPGLEPMTMRCERGGGRFMALELSFENESDADAADHEEASQERILSFIKSLNTVSLSVIGRHAAIYSQCQNKDLEIPIVPLGSYTRFSNDDPFALQNDTMLLLAHKRDKFYCEDVTGPVHSSSLSSYSAAITVSFSVYNLQINPSKHLRIASTGRIVVSRRDRSNYTASPNTANEGPQKEEGDTKSLESAPEYTPVGRVPTHERLPTWHPASPVYSSAEKSVSTDADSSIHALEASAAYSQASDLPDPVEYLDTVLGEMKVAKEGKDDAVRISQERAREQLLQLQAQEMEAQRHREVEQMRHLLNMSPKRQAKEARSTAALSTGLNRGIAASSSSGPKPRDKSSKIPTKSNLHRQKGTGGLHTQPMNLRLMGFPHNVPPTAVAPKSQVSNKKDSNSRRETAIPMPVFKADSRDAKGASAKETDGAIYVGKGVAPAKESASAVNKENMHGKNDSEGGSVKKNVFYLRSRTGAAKHWRSYMYSSSEAEKRDAVARELGGYDKERTRKPITVKASYEVVGGGSGRGVRLKPPVPKANSSKSVAAKSSTGADSNGGKKKTPPGAGNLSSKRRLRSRYSHDGMLPGTKPTEPARISHARAVTAADTAADTAAGTAAGVAAAGAAAGAAEVRVRWDHAPPPAPEPAPFLNIPSKEQAAAAEAAMAVEAQKEAIRQANKDPLPVPPRAYNPIVFVNTG